MKSIIHHLNAGHFHLMVWRRKAAEPTDDSEEWLPTNRELYKGSNFDLLVESKVILFGLKQNHSFDLVLTEG